VEATLPRQGNTSQRQEGLWRRISTGIYITISMGTSHTEIYRIWRRYDRSGNLYAYCMGNPIGYTDLTGNKAGDKFFTRNGAARDFAKEINGISIQEDIEYASYIYSLKREVEILGYTFVLPIKYYSYTEPYTDRNSGHVYLDVYNPDIPDGAVWEATIHTHGAWKEIDNEKLKEYEIWNDRFSPDDEDWANTSGRPFYLVSPIGRLQIFIPGKGVLSYKEIDGKWKYAHDKNAPDLPDNHDKDCENCY